MPNIVALIPSRSGSKRIPGKNIRALASHPMLAYSITAARESGVFSHVIVSTDSEDYAKIAQRYGASYLICPLDIAHKDNDPDIKWITHAIELIRPSEADAFAILRPTSPFRSAATIRRAWAEFSSDATADSLRAVRRVTEHPGKMWIRRITPAGERIVPYWPEWYRNGVSQPYHSMPTQQLPETYVQSAALEMAWTRVVRETGMISGTNVRPFLMDWPEDLDINHEQDFLMAEMLVARGLATLPDVGATVGV